ncbi:ABC transporter G family member 33-like [Gossypium australe]|uniref:ABC transporter G family member 33-like n=1 Tax=Gossypium australe TaxID=47621 RepID=A0A5B6WJY3_9ROSI|nr:ABC transporter G family member 33-like [Gossypium australe]
MTYQLELPLELDLIHDVFDEEPVQILNCEVKHLRRKWISLVKVLWRNHGTEEAMWESKDSIRQQYPYLLKRSKIQG